MTDNNILAIRKNLIAEIDRQVEDKILERTNADLLIKLINNADSISEAISIASSERDTDGKHIQKQILCRSD